MKLKTSHCMVRSKKKQDSTKTFACIPLPHVVSVSPSRWQERSQLDNYFSCFYGEKRGSPFVVIYSFEYSILDGRLGKLQGHSWGMCLPRKRTFKEKKILHHGFFFSPNFSTF